MLPNPIPGLTRGADPTLPRQVLENRLKRIDRRRAEIEAQLSQITDDSYQAQELKAERAALGNMRAECEAALNPKPQPPRHPALERAYAEQRERDKGFLRATIKQQTEQAEYAAQREEAAGNHRSARLHRLTIPEIPTRICAEFGKDPALLVEIDEEGERRGEEKNSRKAEDQ